MASTAKSLASWNSLYVVLVYSGIYLQKNKVLSCYHIFYWEQPFSRTHNLHVMISLGLSGNLLSSSVTVNSSDAFQGLAYNDLVISLFKSFLLPPSLVHICLIFSSFYHGTETEAELTNYLWSRDCLRSSHLQYIYVHFKRCVSVHNQKETLKFKKGIEFGCSKEKLHHC